MLRWVWGGGRRRMGEKEGTRTTRGCRQGWWQGLVGEGISMYVPCGMLCGVPCTLLGPCYCDERSTHTSCCCCRVKDYTVAPYPRTCWC